MQKHHMQAVLVQKKVERKWKGVPQNNVEGVTQAAKTVSVYLVSN